MRETGSTIDADEIGRFTAQADRWWDPEGAFRPLHLLNPVRLRFVRQYLVTHFRRDAVSLKPFKGLSLLDIGCGGGLMSEPMSRLGFDVTGIDADVEAITVARAHAGASGLVIDYRTGTAEALVETAGSFDVVLALEVIEHVADRAVFLECLGDLVRPGGAFIGATLNRTARSFALAVIGAEYVLGWLPRGTHDWRKFMRPSELVLGLRRHRLYTTQIAGIGYDWVRGEWVLSRNLEVNFILAAERR